MNMEPESLHNVLDSAFAGISQVREAFTPQLRPKEAGTITSVATGIAEHFMEVMHFDDEPLDQMTDAEQVVRTAAAEISAQGSDRLDTADKLSDEDRETIIKIVRQAQVHFQPKPEATPKSESPTEVKPKK